jgi:hypothetical protein
MLHVTSFVLIEMLPDRRVKDTKDFDGDYTVAFHRSREILLPKQFATKMTRTKETEFLGNQWSMLEQRAPPQGAVNGQEFAI